MKAKLVYKYLNFERGKDPKEVLGIGIIGIINSIDNKLKPLGFKRTTPDDYYLHAFDMPEYIMNLIARWARNEDDRDIQDDEVTLFRIKKTGKSEVMYSLEGGARSGEGTLEKFLILKIK